MTVEQRILDENFEILETKEILPGGKLKTTVIGLNPDHPHQTRKITFVALCDEEDTQGTIIFEDPEAGSVSKNFTGEQKPYHLIQREEGLGLIEWEHVRK